MARNGALRFFTLNSYPGSRSVVRAILDMAPEVILKREWSAVILDSPLQVRAVGHEDNAYPIFDVLTGVNRWRIQQKAVYGTPDWAWKLSTGVCIAVDLRLRTRLGMRSEVLLPEASIRRSVLQILLQISGETRRAREMQDTSPRESQHANADMVIRVNQSRLPLGR